MEGQADEHSYLQTKTQVGIYEPKAPAQSTDLVNENHFPFPRCCMLCLLQIIGELSEESIDPPVI